MPYKSQAQRRLFHWLESQGKIAPEKVHEYDVASKGKKMPERVRRAFGGEVYAKKDAHCPACDLPLDSVPVAMDAGEGCARCGYGSAKNVPKRMASGGEVPEQPAYRSAVNRHLEMMKEGLSGAMKEMEPKRRYRPFDATPRSASSGPAMAAGDSTVYRAGGGSVFGELVSRTLAPIGRALEGKTEDKSKDKEEDKDEGGGLSGKIASLLKSSGGAGVAPAGAEAAGAGAAGAEAAGAGAAGAAAAIPPVPLARGGRVQCAHCGETNYVSNKAHGGMAPAKEEYPIRKTGRVDDGKPKAGFAKAIKSRR